MRKTVIFLWVVFVYIGVRFAAWSLEENAILVMCDVGQGDAFLLNYQSKQLLIDAGPDESVLSCLEKHMPVWDRTIETVVLTHLDLDHVAGMIPIVNRYKIDQIITNGVPPTTKTATTLFERASQKQIFVKNGTVGDEIEVGPMRLSLLWPKQTDEREKCQNTQEKNDESIQKCNRLVKKTADPNTSSVVLRLKMGDFTGLFFGDLPKNQEKELVSSGFIEKATIMKIGHHGSTTSSSDELLEVARPEYAFLSVGIKNKYGHPDESVIHKYVLRGIKIFRTDQDGEVVVTTNGKKLWIQKGKNSKM